MNKIAITPANTTDAQEFKPVWPRQGAAYADKTYSIKPAQTAALNKGVHLKDI